MLDTLITGGTLVDGTGAEARPADIGIADGRIVAVADPGELADANATETVDATGLVVCPGFIDPHTHYDAQIFWDPRATPSNTFGVTSVVGGNCGFSLAPLSHPSDGEYLKRMMVKVEGMELAALEQGVPVGLGELRRLPAGRRDPEASASTPASWWDIARSAGRSCETTPSATRPTTTRSP